MNSLISYSLHENDGNYNGSKELSLFTFGLTLFNSGNFTKH